jgi:putative membrane protein
MENVIQAMLLLMAMQHLLFLGFEMFGWQRFGPRLFKRKSPDFFKQTRALMANQGLYNGFLAAGLLWAFWADDAVLARDLTIFFCSCVAAAGWFGGSSVSKMIWAVQALPAVITLLLLWW